MKLYTIEDEEEWNMVEETFNTLLAESGRDPESRADGGHADRRLKRLQEAYGREIELIDGKAGRNCGLLAESGSADAVYRGAADACHASG